MSAFAYSGRIRMKYKSWVENFIQLVKRNVVNQPVPDRGFADNTVLGVKNMESGIPAVLVSLPC